MALYHPWYRGGSVREYWKLEDHSRKTAGEAKRELIKRGFFTQKSIGKERCIALLGRADRGYLSYEKYDETELRRFCESRSLSIAAESTTSKADLVAVLEQADDTWTFPLLDLPPELRLQIYDHHFAIYNHLEVTNVVPPPVTAVCRQLRNEALPLFYDTHSLCFTASFLQSGLASTTINFNHSTTNMVRRLRDSSFLLLRRLHLILTIANNTSWMNERVDCKIDLGGSHTAASVRDCSFTEDAGGSRPEEEISAMARVSSVLNGMTARGEGRALRRGDIKVLIQALYPGNLKVVTGIEGEDA
ncbi:hypothetical protein LTR56_007873 [Elasticomyces elasticus]|nr:hypothetical protein LTR56_007873 [Elasticomyces elasticus]KAK3667922.1 hypothetical protein LTR22_001367 [Elasticomyces elasticus]KAK4932085.1 hypothetical protein LTR49_001382 [Elasticomyces elasticus]KAK5745846.1 hypothetical protein LTS12_022953 [Elasticomyces elasticus]